MYNSSEKWNDFCREYLEKTYYELQTDKSERELLLLFKKIENEKIPDIDTKYFNVSHLGSSSLIPRVLPNNVLKKVIQEFQYKRDHPYSEKANSFLFYILFLYKGEHSTNFRIDETNYNEVLDFYLKYVIEAAQELLFREDKISYTPKKSIGEIYNNKYVSFTLNEENRLYHTLDFRCTLDDKETLDIFFNKIHEFPPHNFTKKEIIFALIVVTAYNFVEDKKSFSSHLNDSLLQENKLSASLTYKYNEIFPLVVFYSLCEKIKDSYPIQYSSAEIFRALILYSKEVNLVEVHNFIMESRICEDFFGMKK